MAKKVVTNDGKKGGWLVGKRHYDKDGKPLGGIKAIVTDAGNRPVELEGGEVIINREASKKYWKELSKINQSAGNGVAIGPPTNSFDEDPSEDYENGGKIEFNANHIPNKWILNYAIKIKEDHPEIWKLGGNIFGNEAFVNLKRVAERGHWLDSEEWMYKKWRSYVARHQRDYRIEGVVAMLKWVDKVEKGWQYMKNLIEEEINKREARNSKKMIDGGNVDDTRFLKVDKYILNRHPKNGDILKGGKYQDYEIVAIKKQIKVDKITFNLWLKKGINRRIVTYIPKTKKISDFIKVQKGYAKGFRYDEWSDGPIGKQMRNGGNLSKTPAPTSNKMETGGSISNTNAEKFMQWFIEWYKPISDAINITFSLPNELLPFKEKNVVILDLFEKKNQNIDAKKYLHEIVKKADELGVIIYLEPKPRHKYFLNNEAKKKKITPEYLVDYYKNFGFNVTINKKFMKRLPQMNNGGNLSKTPAPASERIKGSKFNAPGSAKDSKSGSEIKFDDNTIASIQSLIDGHNEKYPSKKITLGVAKAVVRRGMGAYSSSHRPTISGGKPNSRTAWGLARLKAFIYKAQKGKSKSGKYSQDNDLFGDLDIKVSKFVKGGKILNEEEEQSFKEWMEDGNVHKFEDGYSTQDAQWSNRLKGLDELRKYFRKEFLSDSYKRGGGIDEIRDVEYTWREKPSLVNIIQVKKTSKGNYSGLFSYTDENRTQWERLDKYFGKELFDGKIGQKMEQGGKLQKQILSSEYYESGGGIDYDSIQPKDKNGVPKIDDKSLEILTERILELPQTKSFHTDSEGNYTKERKELHKEIINEFKKQAVCITKGQPIAILMGGSPASGKSSFIRKYRPYLMVNDIVKVDADEIRSKLPEYKGFNATQTHLETKDIVNTLISDRNIGVPCNFDLIYDGTMNSVKSYEPLIDLLKKRNYKVYIIYIDRVPYETVVSRMKERYKKSGRFVPIEVIDDFFSKGRAALDKLKKEVDGYVVVDGSNFDYNIIERGGEELPQERDHKFLGELIDQKQLETIEYKGGGKVGGGDCYKTAGDFVLDSKLLGKTRTNQMKFVGEPYVVHAQVTGQGEISGLKYGHAWVEDDVLVYDYSNGRKLEIPKNFYYAVGKIKTTKPRYFKYTFEQARKKMLDSGHYGPWDLKTESGL